MTFLDRLNSPKFDFTQNRSGGKIIKFQQIQALTSHFESFWSIVDCLANQLFISFFFSVLDENLLDPNPAVNHQPHCIQSPQLVLRKISKNLQHQRVPKLQILNRLNQKPSILKKNPSYKFKKKYYHIAAIFLVVKAQ